MGTPPWLRTGRRVLVVSPHPDDDVIGCGGTLHGLARAGGQPTVMYVTDGSASHPNSLEFPPSKLASLREAEAREALQELGVRSEPIFLRIRDGSVSAMERTRCPRLVESIHEAVSTLSIDTILGPWLDDPHDDHAATARAVRTACGSSKLSLLNVYYAVWAPIRSNSKQLQTLGRRSVFEVRLDADQLEAKRRALFCHRSQTSALIRDDPDGFRIDESLLDEWLQPVERFYC